MRKFVHKIVIVFLPFLLYYSLPMVCLYRAGELFKFDTYICPIEEGSLFGLAYSYYDKEYKFYMTNDLRNPQVLALGSSRIMQVKQNLIQPNVSFYNAGGAIQNIYEYRLFLEKLTKKPKVVLANFDQFLFNPNFEDQRSSFSTHTYDKPKYSFAKHLKSCVTFYEDLYAGKINIKEIFESRSIGMNAICNHYGFTTDGSYYEGMIEKIPESSLDYNFKDTMERIRNKNQRFQGCDHADITVLAEVDSLLCYCDTNDILLIGILPPFAPMIYQKMKDDGGYGYLTEIPDLLKDVFSQHHAKFMDFTQYKNSFSKDIYYLDGFHGSDIVYNSIIADILDSVPQIRHYFIPSDSIRKIGDRSLPKHTKYHKFID